MLYNTLSRGWIDWSRDSLSFVIVNSSCWRVQTVQWVLLLLFRLRAALHLCNSCTDIRTMDYDSNSAGISICTTIEVKIIWTRQYLAGNVQYNLLRFFIEFSYRVMWHYMFIVRIYLFVQGSKKIYLVKLRTQIYWIWLGWTTYVQMYS